METQNKSENYKEEKTPAHADLSEKPNEGEDVKAPDEKGNDPDDDPLEVVIEEEKDEQEELDTEDDLFDDNELDLDPTLDRDEW